MFSRNPALYLGMISAECAEAPSGPGSFPSASLAAMVPGNLKRIIVPLAVSGQATQAAYTLCSALLVDAVVLQLIDLTTKTSHPTGRLDLGPLPLNKMLDPPGPPPLLRPECLSSLRNSLYTVALVAELSV